MSINSINTNSAANVQQVTPLQQSAKEPMKVSSESGAKLQEDTVILSSAKAQVDLPSTHPSSDLNAASSMIGNARREQSEEGGYDGIDVSGSGGMIPPK